MYRRTTQNEQDKRHWKYIWTHEQNRGSVQDASLASKLAPVPYKFRPTLPPNYAKWRPTRAIQPRRTSECLTSN